MESKVLHHQLKIVIQLFYGIWIGEITYLGDADKNGEFAIRTIGVD